MNFKALKISAMGLAIGAAIFGAGSSAYAATPYTIKDDDTFWKLSRTYKVSLQSVLDVNKGVDPLNLQPGQIVQLPDGIKKPAANKVKAASAAPAVTLAADKGNTFVTASGETVTYSKVIAAQASAYSADPSENGGYGAVDYFGNPLKLGTVAVDPKVIPLGTTLYITGYDFSGLPAGGLLAKATDIGGAIKGNRVDIFVPGSKSFVNQFGFQDINVYVIK